MLIPKERIAYLEERVFDGLDFEPFCFDGRKCYKGKDGFYYRLDHFDGTYVIEYADNKELAENNCFDDADRFDDDIPEERLIKILQEALRKYVDEG